jgi:hypothetical protein
MKNNMKNKRRAKMPDEKGTIIELTEEQKEQMRQATGQEHEGIRVETIGSELAPRLAPKKSLKKTLSAKKSLKKTLSAKKSLKKHLTAKKSLKKHLTAKKSLKKTLSAKKSLKT